MESAIRLGVVDDRSLMRDVLASRIRQDNRFRLVYACSSDSLLEQPTRTQRSDLLLLCVPDEVCSDNPRWTSMIRQVRSQSPGTKVVVSNAVRDNTHAVSLIESGAMGFISSDASWEQLGDSLLEVYEGRPLCPQFVIDCVLARLRELLISAETRSQPHNLLSDRESDVVRLVAEGCSNKEIATTLGISVSTTKNHVHSIRKKLGVVRRRELLGFC